MNSKEIWKPVVGYEELYEVSSWGNVRALNWHREGIVKEKNQRLVKNYLGTTLSKNGEMTTKKIHRLVAKAFIPNPKNKPCVNHIDCDKTNNHISNLEWCTYQENMDHAVENDLLPEPAHKGVYGKDNPNSKKVLQITPDGKLVKEWDSMSDVKRELDIPVPHIVRVCNGQRNKTRGFVWKRKEDLTEEEIKHYYD